MWFFWFVYSNIFSVFYCVLKTGPDWPVGSVEPRTGQIIDLI